MFRVSRHFLRILRKFRTNFNFVFRENFANLKENIAKQIISRNFRENTQTKILQLPNVELHTVCTVHTTTTPSS